MSKEIDAKLLPIAQRIVRSICTMAGDDVPARRESVTLGFLGMVLGEFTDLELIQSVLQRSGIQSTEDTQKRKQWGPGGSIVEEESTEITLEQQAVGVATTIGYSGFSAALRFDRDGRLVAVGGWEG